MLGFSGAWIANLTALEPYKPYVAGVTLALLGYGLWHVSFKPKPPCEDGPYCARPQSALTTKAVLWLGLAVAILALTFDRSEELTTSLPSLLRITYAVFCLKITTSSG